MSPDDFAKTATEFLQGQGEQRPIAVDPAHDRLVVGAPPELVSFISLSGTREEFTRSSAAERTRVLGRRLWANVHRPPVELARVIRSSTLPRIRDRAWFSAVRRQAELELGADEDAIDEVMLPHHPLNEELAVHLAFELPTSVAEVGADRLEAWGQRFEDLLAAATENLRARSTLPFERPGPGVYVSPYHDTFDASRMVLVDLFRELDVAGAPVVVAPTHDILFVTGDEDEEGLVQVGAWADEAMLEPRAHSAITFRLENDAWLPWLPPRTSGAWAKLKLLQLQTLASAYARQKEVLDALLEANGHDINVATLRAFRTPAGHVLTACAWVEGVEALLPETDRVDFVPTGKNTPVASTTFEVARRTVPELMQPIGDRPERWRVKGFPSVDQLVEMAREGKLLE